MDRGAPDRCRVYLITPERFAPKPFAGRPDSREAYDHALLEVLKQHEVELVLLAGYMKS